VLLLQLVATLGALQGVLLLLLIGTRYRHPKNLPLALLLLVFSLRLATIPTWNPDTLIASRWVYPATAPLPFLFGPLLWWAARELAREAGATPKHVTLHVLPYLIETALVTTTVLTLSGTEYRQLITDIFSGHPPIWLPVRNGLKVAVNAVYGALAATLAFGAASARVERARRLWLRVLVATGLASLLPFAVVAVESAPSARLAAGSTTPFVLLAVAMAVFVYGISTLVLFAPEAAPGSHHRRTAAGAAEQADPDCASLARRLRRELVAGAYRDPEVSLRTLAYRLGSHPNRLSLAVNRTFGESLPQLLTRCRLDYFVRSVLTGALEDQNILELAFEAGFSSKSTFNRVFKAQYGVPPSVFARGAAKRRARQTGLPSAAAGLATRPRRATMPVNGNGTNRSVQRHPDPAFARDARGHGRG
jgi:AraC-like DNA-binding protein